MGLLDDLEKEAERRKADANSRGRQPEGLEALYRETTEPAIQALYEYLEKLTKHLTFLKPEVRFEYQIAGYGPVRARLDHEFELRQDVQPTSREIKLRCTAPVTTEECPAVDVEGSTRIRTIASLMQKARISGFAPSKRDAAGEVIAGQFRARGKVEISLNVHADIASNLVRITFSNFDDFNTVTRAYAPAQLTDTLFDALGRYLTREDLSLVREELPDAYRQQLRKKLQQDEMKRKWEERLAQKTEEEAAPANDQDSLKSRLIRQTDALGKRFNQFIDRLRKRGD